MNTKTVSIFYYCDHSVELGLYIGEFPIIGSGRVIIDEKFKKGKTVIAVCDGKVNLLNKLGDRVNQKNITNYG